MFLNLHNNVHTKISQPSKTFHTASKVVLFSKSEGSWRTLRLMKFSGSLSLSFLRFASSLRLPFVPKKLAGPLKNGATVQKSSAPRCWRKERCKGYQRLLLIILRYICRLGPNQNYFTGHPYVAVAYTFPR